MIGTPVTKETIDDAAGRIAQALHVALREAADLRAYLNVTSNDDLVVMGYTTAECLTLKAAFDDADLLQRVYAGAAIVATAKDFRTFLQKTRGIRL